MKKILLAAAIMGLAVAAGIAAAKPEKYVRKQLQPNFFIPEKDLLNQPEKLPPLPQVFKEKEPEEALASVPEETEDEEDIAVETEQAQPSLTPAYQQKFSAYHRDIELINRRGEIPSNPQLEDDLKQMESGRRFEVKETEIVRSYVSEDFEKVLAKSLKSD